jgi:cyclase
MSSSAHDHPTELAPVRLVEVSGGVYAFIQPDGSWWINNTGFLAGRRGAVAVDSCSTERRTRAFLDAIRSVTGAPVQALVNTHHHGDHTHGNFLFRPAAVIGHQRCREQVLAFGHPSWEGVFSPIDFGQLDIEAPFITFTDRLDLYVDDLLVELHFIGTAAHTTNDVVAWIPERRVLFAGDLAFNGGTPFVVMGSVSGSLLALERLRAFDAEVVVPGHGDVCGPEVFDTIGRYLEFVQHTARDARAAGLKPLEAARDLDLGPFAHWLDTERIVGNLHRAYAELDGAAPGDPIDLRAAITDMVTFNGGPLRCLA